MDTLDNTDWDVVIAGTGFPQSLLALSLSRSGKKVLHLDSNGYYGGNEAALSLSEAEEWAYKHSGDGNEATNPYFTNAAVSKPGEETSGGAKVGFSRAYSLALAPQLIYARSNLLPALVSSRTHNQLDFQAVGSWFIVQGEDTDGPPSILRVPSGREDVFRDDSLDLRAKRSLMKFMRFVASYDEESELDRWTDIKSMPFAEALQSRFGLKAETAIAPLLALALTQGSATDLTIECIVPRIARHFRSIGMFGPGFSAVLPKWGGLAEIAQVACRACAVGGAVYVLGKSIAETSQLENGGYALKLGDGEAIKTEWLTGCSANLPAKLQPPVSSDSPTIININRGIFIVSSPLTSLFPPTSEGGVIPAGAVVRVETSSASRKPVHILAHSSESGECPAGQCVLHTFANDDSSNADAAVNSLLQCLPDQPEARVLWSMHFTERAPKQTNHAAAIDGRSITLPALSADIVLVDEVLDNVKRAWQSITGETEELFMNFKPREGIDDDDGGEIA